MEPRVHVIDGFVWRLEEPRYFVARLGEGSAGFANGYRFRVELLDDEGRGGAFALFQSPAEVLRVHGHQIPRAVAEAAFRQAPGSGDYVTSEGFHAPPSFGAE